MNSHTFHQREMEQRIKRFDSECEMAINHIGHLKEQARSYLDQLSGEPNVLKNRFLQCTKQLDKFMYHITEFNLIASNLGIKVSIDQNTLKKSAPTPKSNKQNETPPHSNTYRSPNTKVSRPKQARKEENLKEFRDSGFAKKKEMSENNRDETTDVRGVPHDVFLHRKADGCQPLGLPPQPKLDSASVSKATIITVSGAQLWLVMDDDSLTNLVQEMTEYYTNQEINQDFVAETVCAYYDEAETKCFLRALYINSEDDPEIFLVDTGEFQPALQSQLRPLHPRFCLTPPLAHLCCLADVDQTEDNNFEDRQTEFLKQFLGQSFKIKLKMDDADEDPSKLVAVYLFLEDGTTVNELLVQGLASSKPELKEKSLLYTIPNTPDENQNIPQPLDSKHNVTIQDGNKRVNEMGSIQGSKKDIDIDDELNYSKCPEYENALEAVTVTRRFGCVLVASRLKLRTKEYSHTSETSSDRKKGYSNRDEMDICKHYTGGEGCFKGHRCKKRHVMMHPDGWTLDRVSVTVKCRPAALPAPGTCHKVKVTHVDSTCQLYVHFEQPEEPMSLANLVDEMTRAVADSKSLKLEPAPGELLSAQFSDGRYYRARVITSDDRETEVMYIDYGNTATVLNTDLRPLESRWLALPVQAVPCRLAGVSDTVSNVSDVSSAEVLKELALDKTMEAHIIARDYDELSVKLLDSDGFDIAEQLAAFAGVELRPYEVEHDSQRRCHHVPA